MVLGLEKLFGAKNEKNKEDGIDLSALHKLGENNVVPMVPNAVSMHNRDTVDDVIIKEGDVDPLAHLTGGVRNKLVVSPVGGIQQTVPITQSNTVPGVSTMPSASLVPETPFGMNTNEIIPPREIATQPQTGEFGRGRVPFEKQPQELRTVSTGPLESSTKDTETELSELDKELSKQVPKELPVSFSPDVDAKEIPAMVNTAPSPLSAPLTSNVAHLKDGIPKRKEEEQLNVSSTNTIPSSITPKSDVQRQSPTLAERLVGEKPQKIEIGKLPIPVAMLDGAIHNTPPETGGAEEPKNEGVEKIEGVLNFIHKHPDISDISAKQEDTEENNEPKKDEEIVAVNTPPPVKNRIQPIRKVELVDTIRGVGEDIQDATSKIQNENIENNDSAPPKTKDTIKTEVIEKSPNIYGELHPRTDKNEKTILAAPGLEAQQKEEVTPSGEDVTALESPENPYSALEKEIMNVLTDGGTPEEQYKKIMNPVLRELLKALVDKVETNTANTTKKTIEKLDLAA